MAVAQIQQGWFLYNHRVTYDADLPARPRSPRPDDAPAPGRTRGARPRSLLALLAAVALVLAGVAACSSDDDGGDASPTTEAGQPTEGDPGGEGPDEGGTSPDEAPGTTGTTEPAGSGRPLNESELVSSLLAPEDLGEGFASDEAMGPGDLSPTLCPDVSVEVTWVDQASQNLLQGEGDEMVIVNQSILDFEDDATASAFFDELLDGITTCNPAVEVTDLDEPGDQAVRVELTGAGPAGAGALLRVGDRVNYLLALGVGGTVVEVLTPDVLQQVADNLGE